MDFSKLGSNEKLAVYGAIAAIIGPVLSSTRFGFGAGGLTLILSLAMLAIIFLPQLSPQTQLPGSKGSLMVIVGGVAAISAALALLASFGYFSFFGSNIVAVLGWLIGIGGGLLMGWAGWQEFQSEGGELKLGTSTGAASSGSAAAPPAAPAEPADAPAAAPPAAAPPAAEPAPPPAAPAPPTAYQPPAAEPASEPMADEPAPADATPDDEERRQA
jgi:hypothetical protein